jgi:hypothetical protein
MGMVLVLRHIEASAIDPLLSNPEQIEDILDWEDEDGDGENTEPETDLDKSWHAIHYLLTGTAWGGEPPLSSLLLGGEEVGDVDVGYGPARVMRPAEVANFDSVLSAISSDEMRRRYDPAAMMKEDIYPNVWDRGEEEIEYVIEYFEVLKQIVHDARASNKGLIIYLA